MQICPPSCLEKPIRKGIGGGLGFRRELQRFSGTRLEKTRNKKRQRELAKSNEICGERNLSSLFPSNILLVMHLPTHQKYYPHLSALPAVFADAVMENNFCHLSNYSLFIAREPPDILAGDNRANRSVSLTFQESGYLFVFSGTSPAPTLAKNDHLFVFWDLWEDW